MGKGQQQKRQAEKLSASTGAKKLVFEKGLDTTIPTSMRESMSAYLGRSEDRLRASSDIAHEQDTEEGLISDHNTQATSDAAMETDVMHASATVHLSSEEGTTMTTSTVEVMETMGESTEYYSQGILHTTETSAGLPITTTSLSYYSPATSTATCSLTNTDGNQSTTVVQSVSATLSHTIVDLSAMITTMKSFRYDLPTVTELSARIDSQQARLSREFLHLFVQPRSFTLSASALVYAVYSDWIDTQTGVCATEAQLAVFSHTMATLCMEIKWEINDKFKREYISLRSGSASSTLSNPVLEALESIYKSREDQINARLLQHIRMSTELLSQHYQEIACQNWPDSSMAHAHLADLIAVSQHAPQHVPTEDDWEKQLTPTKAIRQKQTIFNSLDRRYNDKRSGIRYRTRNPDPDNITELLQCKTPLATRLAIKDHTRTAIMSIRLDGLGSATGHPQESVTTHIRSCTEVDITVYSCEFMIILNFYAENKERDRSEIQHLLTSIGSEGNYQGFNSGLLLDDDYFNTMYATSAWVVHRHDNILADHSNFNSGVIIKLRARALFGTFYANSASGVIYPAVSTIRDRLKPRYYVAYSVPITADVQKFNNVTKYGSLGVLRGLPGRHDHHAGTVACLNAITTALDNNMHPGRYAILLHCVFHQVVLQQEGRTLKYIKPAMDVAGTQTRSELVAEVLYLGTEDGCLSYSDSKGYQKAWNGLFLSAREGRRSGDIGPILIHPNGYPIELFDTLRQCLAQPNRHTGFRTPRVTIITNIPCKLLAQDLLTVLARNPSNLSSLQDVCQATVVPPVQAAPYYRLLITWLAQSGQQLDVEPLESHWNLTPLTIQVEEGWYPGYGDLMKLKDMWLNDDATDPILDMGTLFRTPDWTKPRSGRGGRRESTQMVLASKGIPMSSDTSLGVLTSTISPTTDSYSSIARRQDPEFLSFLGSIIDQKLTPITNRLDELSVKTATLDHNIAKADVERKISRFIQRVGQWCDRQSRPLKSVKETEWLAREYGNLSTLRATILAASGYDPDDDPVPDLPDFSTGPA